MTGNCQDPTCLKRATLVRHYVGPTVYLKLCVPCRNRRVAGWLRQNRPLIAR